MSPGWQGFFIRPWLALEQPGIHTQTWYEDGLGFISCKLDLPPATPGKDVTELTIGDMNHVCGLLSGVALGEDAVVSIG